MMMRIFLRSACAFLLVLSAGCDLNGPEEHNGINFQQTYSDLHVWYGTPFVATPTGSLLIDPGADTSSIYIDTRIEFDQGGTIRSRTTLDHTPYSKSSAMIRCASGDLVFIVQRTDSSVSAIQSFGSDSVPRWTTPIPGAGPFGPSWILDRGNGEIWSQVIVSSSSSGTGWESQLVVLQAGSGKILRRESLGTVRLQYPHVMANGNLCGITEEYSDKAHRGYFSIVTLDPSHHVLNKAVLKDTADDHWVQSVQYLGDTAVITGGLFINGYTGTTAVSHYGIDGAMRWSTVTEVYSFLFEMRNVADMTVNNGTIYFATVDMAQRGALSMIDVDGAMISQRSFLNRQIAGLCPRTVGGAIALLRELNSWPNQKTELISLP